MENWKQLITEQLQKNGETWGDIIATTLTEEELNSEFDSGYGWADGKPFTAWTKNYVYFPAVYDGSEWCDSVPRNPCDIAKKHVGGQ